MGKYSHLSDAEKMELVAKGEIDIYDVVEVELPNQWHIAWEQDYDKPVRKVPESMQLHPQVPMHFLVKIRLNNNRIYELAKIPIQPDKDSEDHAVEIFHHFYQKLNKRHIHVHKPIHRAIRTSIVDELFVERVP